MLFFCTFFVTLGQRECLAIFFQLCDPIVKRYFYRAWQLVIRKWFRYQCCTRNETPQRLCCAWPNLADFLNVWRRSSQPRSHSFHNWDAAYMSRRNHIWISCVRSSTCYANEEEPYLQGLRGKCIDRCLRCFPRDLRNRISG